jgi:hypothetical protein
MPIDDLKLNVKTKTINEEEAEKIQKALDIEHRIIGGILIILLPTEHPDTKADKPRCFGEYDCQICSKLEADEVSCEDLEECKRETYKTEDI